MLVYIVVVCCLMWWCVAPINIIMGWCAVIMLWVWYILVFYWYFNFTFWCVGRGVLRFWEGWYRKTRSNL